jgi:hypothetical protein
MESYGIDEVLALKSHQTQWNLMGSMTTDLDQSQWLTSPGFNQSINRLLEAERQLNEKWNKATHNLIWNRKLEKKQSKPAYGKFGVPHAVKLGLGPQDLIVSLISHVVHSI